MPSALSGWIARHCTPAPPPTGVSACPCGDCFHSSGVPPLPRHYVATDASSVSSGQRSEASSVRSSFSTTTKHVENKHY